MQSRGERRAFTLVEALIALTIVSTGMGLFWDGYIVHARLQARLDAEVDALDDLSGACEQLGVDADAVTARPQVRADGFDLPTRDGLVHWTAAARGLTRSAPDGRTRVYPTLKARNMTVETVGPRMLVLATLAGPRNADALVARALPIGSAR